MKARLATSIGFLSLATAGAVAAFMFARKIPLAPPGPAPAAIVAGDKAAEKTRPIEPGKSLEDRTAAAVGSAADALGSILGDRADRRTDRTDGTPAFDVARIERTGEAVVAGRAAPGATVELLRGGEPHDQTLANEAGEFVIIPRPLPPGNYDLTLRSTQRDGQKLISKNAVAVVVSPRGDRPAAALIGPRKDVGPSVEPRTDDGAVSASVGPGNDDKPVVGALVVPDKPALAPPKPARSRVGADAIDAVDIRIDAVDTKPGGKLYVSARSTPGGVVRLYLNDAFIASATPSADGRVAFAIESGMTPGDYRIRLEKVDVSGSIQARTEVPFKAPTSTFATASGTLPTPASRPDGSAQGPLSAGPVAAASDVAENRSAGADRPALPRPAGSSEATENRPTQADRPAAPRPAVVAETGSPPVSAADPADRTTTVVVPKVETTVVSRGDSLWRISRTTYGTGLHYPVIVRANREQIHNPDLIHPGQVFVLPHASDSGRR